MYAIRSYYVSLAGRDTFVRALTQGGENSDRVLLINSSFTVVLVMLYGFLTTPGLSFAHFFARENLLLIFSSALLESVAIRNNFV